MKMSLKKKVGIVSGIIVVLALIIIPLSIINSISNNTKKSITGSWSCITIVDGKEQDLIYTFNPDKTYTKKIIMKDETQEYQLKYYKLSLRKVKLSKTDILKYDKLMNTLTDETNNCTFIKQ